MSYVVCCSYIRIGSAGFCMRHHVVVEVSCTNEIQCIEGIEMQRLKKCFRGSSRRVGATNLERFGLRGNDEQFVIPCK